MTSYHFFQCLESLVESWFHSIIKPWLFSSSAHCKSKLCFAALVDTGQRDNKNEWWLQDNVHLLALSFGKLWDKRRWFSNLT